MTTKERKLPNGKVDKGGYFLNGERVAYFQQEALELILEDRTLTFEVRDIEGRVKSTPFDMDRVHWSTGYDGSERAGRLAEYKDFLNRSGLTA